uniref:SWIM-type domain-containing protein n=1 Tax=Schistosoma japonicum TaxID=6182 RepID=Q5DCI2_SCHJA|nr:unknown [Schistosoma japonicum]
MKALLIIECGSITIERSKSSQHQLFRVESNTGVINYCSNYTRYCRCFNTIQKYIDPLYELWCEHNLAIFLAELMGKTKVIYLHDDVICQSMKILYNHDVNTTDSSIEMNK